MIAGREYTEAGDKRIHGAAERGRTLATEIRRRIQEALRQRAALATRDAGLIEVTTVGDDVILRGCAYSRGDRALAETMAWGTPGVEKVRDEIEVTKDSRPERSTTNQRTLTTTS
jgi:osmotically-inducible protein OsmY